MPWTAVKLTARAKIRIVQYIINRVLPSIISISFVRIKRENGLWVYPTFSGHRYPVAVAWLHVAAWQQNLVGLG